MSGEKIIHALNAIPDAQLQSAMGVYERKKKLKYIWVRATACAAVLVLLIVAATCGNSAPYFSIYVHANEAGSEQLHRRGVTVFVPVYDASKQPSKKEDPSYRPIFDSNLTGEGNRLWDETYIWLQIRLDDETKNYDQITVLVNGEELQQSLQSGALGFIFNGGEVGRFLVLPVQEITRLDIMLYGDNGEILQHYGMVVEPVEGGWLVTLDKASVASWGSKILSMWD